MNIAKITISKCKDCPSMIYLDKHKDDRPRNSSQYCKFTKRYVNRDAIPDWCPFKIDMMENK